MKKILLAMSLLIVSALSAFSLTLKEAYECINNLPDLKGVEKIQSSDIGDGWLSAIPLEDAQITAKVQEVGSDQTAFYGDKIEEIKKQLPKEDLVLQDSDDSSLIYFYSKPYDKDSSEILILIDQAYQGKTTAVYGKTGNPIITALKAGSIEFTENHKIIVNVPLMVCN